MCAREVLFGHFVWHSWFLYFTLETAMPLDVVKTERMEVLSAIPPPSATAASPKASHEDARGPSDVSAVATLHV